jgi:uncharacterized protein YcaQ
VTHRGAGILGLQNVDGFSVGVSSKTGRDMLEESLSLRQARRLAVGAQLLDGRSDPPPGKEGVAQTIERLGYVQIDTISVVERAHHQTLRARAPDYVGAMLHDLLTVDRRVFEYWGHAASYLPMADYRYYLPRMRRSPTGAWGKDWMTQNADIAERVLERIRKEGPLASKDFEAPEGRKGGTWWDWKPSKMALEMLLAQGKLMIAERRNFQRVYDLTERILPTGVDTTVPDEADVARFLIHRALSAHGIAREREISEHIHGGDRARLSAALRALVEEGDVVRVTVDGLDDQDLFALRGALKQEPTPGRDARCVLLCPFDNLIIQRERTKWLFDFDYTLECYVPAPKRVHGYFVFPILFSDALVGRLDPKADRKSKTLIVRTLRFEPGFNRFDELLPAFAESLARFARFNGCETITVETIKPLGLKRSLKSLIKKALSETV